jgi:hypothetical protein
MSTTNSINMDAAYQVQGYRGIAWRLISADGNNVVAYMIGDDRTFTFDVSEIEVIGEDTFCHSCGQIGCGWC